MGGVATAQVEKFAKPVNEEYLLNHGTDKPIQIEISNVLGAELDGLSIEMDEMWSFCHDKSQQVWLWW